MPPNIGFVFSKQPVQGPTPKFTVTPVTLPNRDRKGATEPRLANR